MLSTYDLYLKIIDKPSKFCYLPSTINTYHDTLIVHVIFPNLKEPLLFQWNKGLISKESNTIEVSRQMLVNNVELKNNELISIRLIANTLIAKDIELIPKTKADWDIVSSQANYIEGNLLRSLFVVYKNQQLIISITPSIKASLIVQNIAFISNNSITDAKIVCITHSNDESVPIARISNQTSLSIAPITAPQSSNINKEELVRTNNNRIKDLTFNNADHKHLNNQDDIQHLVTEKISKTFSPYSVPYHQLSHTIPLQVLPQSYQFKDTRLLHPKSTLPLDRIDCNSSSIGDGVSSSARNDIYNDHSLDDAELDVENILQLYEDFSEPQYRSQQLQPQSSYQDPSRNEDNYSICFVHPSYFILCFEKAMNQRMDTITWSPISEYLVKQEIILGDLTQTQGSKSIPTHSNSNSSEMSQRIPNDVNTSMVHVKFDERIRIGYCVVSTSVRLALDIKDFSSITIHLHDPHRINRNILLPSSIILTPIEWKPYKDDNTEHHSSDKLNESTTNTTKNNNTNIEYEEDLIKIELMHLIEECQYHHIPFLFHNNQIISMKLSTNNKSQVINTLPKEQQPQQQNRSYKVINYFIEFHYDSKDSLILSKKNSNNIQKNTMNYVLFKDSGIEELLLQCMDKVVLRKYILAEPIKDMPLTPNLKQVRILNSHPTIYFQKVIHESLFREFISDIANNGSNEDRIGISREISNSIQQSSLSAISSVQLYPSTCIRILNQYAWTLLPSMVLRRVYAEVPISSIGILLTGPTGTGKTSLLHELSEEYIRKSLRGLTHIISINCKTLKSKPLDTILLTITSAFDSSLNHPSTVLILDNLDAICPCAKNSGQGMIQDERCSVVTIHIERLLRHYQSLQAKRFEIAISLKHAIAKSKETNEQSPYFDHILASTNSDHSLLVIAISESIDTIASSLLQRDCFHKHIELETLSPDLRMKALFQILLKSQVQIIPAIEDVEIKHRESLLNLLLGYRICDIANVARRICQYAFHTMTSSSSGSISILDLLQIVSEFKPIGSSNNKNSSGSSGASNSVDWNDIAGYEETKKSILTIIRNPIIYERLYQKCPIKLPRALLLYGPPGCGKTYLAAAAGKQFGLGFISVRGPQLLDKYIGASEKAVRDLFDSARITGRPSLIFFDEFESLAPKRGKDNTGVTDRIVNQLLTFIDGVESNLGSNVNNGNIKINQPQIFIVAATSRPDLIDAALLRPGRIEKHIYIGLPSLADRMKILKITLEKLEIEITTKIEEVLIFICNHEKANFFTVADWKAVISTAYILATQDYINRIQIKNSNNEITIPTIPSITTSLNINNIDTNTNMDANTNIDTDMRKVLLHDKHISIAFQQTRPSITNEEMQRFLQIYSKFNPNHLHQQYNNNNMEPKSNYPKDHNNNSHSPLIKKDSMNTHNANDSSLKIDLPRQIFH